MNATETLAAIRSICENAPKKDEERTIFEWAVHVGRMEDCIGEIYQLCLNAEKEAE